MASECFYCGARLVKQHGSPRFESDDHIIPRSVIRRSGVTLSHNQHKLNRVKCCFDCNAKKGSMHPVAWMTTMPDDVRIQMDRILQLLPVTLIYNQAMRYTFD